MPAKYGDAPPDVTGRDVYIVDFSYPRDVIERIIVECNTLTVFDHHKTAREALEPLKSLHQSLIPHTPPRVRIVFDMERSGAGIAWDELHTHKTYPAGEEVVVPHPRPWLVDYVEDRDLWRKALPNTEGVAAFLAVQPKTFERWNTISLSSLGDAAISGEALVLGRDQYIEAMRAHAKLGNLYARNAASNAMFHPYSGEVPIVNAPPHAISDLLGALAEGHPFAVGWFQRGDGMYQYSLRSRGEGGEDVSAIAKAFGGGGHRNAAGFTTKERVDV